MPNIQIVNWQGCKGIWLGRWRGIFAVDEDGGVYLGPIEKHFGFGGFHINTTVGHGDAEIVVPISAVKTKTQTLGNRVVVEKHDIGNIGEIIISAVFFGATRHFLRFNFGPNLESAGGGSTPSAGRDKKLKNFLAVFIGSGLLVGEINFNPLIGVGGFAQNIGRRKIKSRYSNWLVVKNAGFG